MSADHVITPRYILGSKDVLCARCQRPIKPDGKDGDWKHVSRKAKT